MKKITKKQQIAASEAGRALSAMRKTFGGGSGRPRKVQHDPLAKRCPCADCRKARGAYPVYVRKTPVK